MSSSILLILLARWYYRPAAMFATIMLLARMRWETSMRLRVQEIAKEKGFTMGRLRRTSGVSHNTIRMIYRDPYRPVQSTTLDKLAAALGVDVSELVESSEDTE